MTEKLLQFIWQYQYFNSGSLTTVEGESLSITRPGTFNTHQGPDFLDAQIKLNGNTWVGHIEIHIESNQWKKHKHHLDQHYANVILHVVWKYDEEIRNCNGLPIPTLELNSRVSKHLLRRFEELMQTKNSIPCSPHLPALNDLQWNAWLQRLAIERLERKTTEVSQLLAKNNDHWEETFWWMLARNFGIRVNAPAFEMLAKSIPVQILAKQKNQLLQLEALLLGQSGLLQDNFSEAYPRMLQKEYLFLARKYSLRPIPRKPAFLRMRPANFPTVRLAQLAKLVSVSSHLFSTILETTHLPVIKNLLHVTANDYWHYHYRFDQPTSYKPKTLGSQMIDNILINTIIPLLFAYGLHKKTEVYKERAIEWLTQIPAEKNSIITCWKKFHVPCQHALASQGLVELKNNYCHEKRCLQCAIGYQVLRQPAS